MNPELSIAVVGGTGKLGYALARRLVRARRSVLIGSRTEASARASAEALAAELGREVGAGTNIEVAARGGLVILTVPAAAQVERLEEIRHAVAGKIVVDTTVPLVPPKVMRVQLPPEGCAAVRANNVLGGTATLVSAFHNVAAHKLAGDGDVGCDILVFGDDPKARGVVVAMIEAMGMRGLQAGALANSAAAEALTSVLIYLNKTYGADGAGIRITGTLTAPPRAE